MRKTSLLLILALTLALLPTLPTGQPPSKTPIPTIQGTTDYPWTMFHYNTLRTGSSPTTAPNTPTLMWTKATGAQVYASPAVSDGTVFIPSYDGNLYAIDEYSGQTRWTYTTALPIYSSPAVSNGIVYVASRDGQVYAINEQTGVLVWRTSNVYNNPSNPITSSLLVANGRVFFGSWCYGSLCNPAGHFEAIDASTGTVLWINATSAAVISSPSADNGWVFVGEDDGTVLAVNATNGHRIWVTSAGATVRNGVVYFGTGRGNLYAVNATTGIQIWGPTLSAGAVTSSPALALGAKMLLVGSNDHYVYALNMTNGSRLWRYPTGGPVSSSPAIADGRVFIGSQDSGVYALGPKIPQLHVTVSPDKTSLLPGEISNLTVTVTDGTSPVSANLTLSSSSGGGFSPPVGLSTGVYTSNYTAPLVNTPSTTTIQVMATEAGFLDGSSQTAISLNPYPNLTVLVSAEPASVSPGGSVFLKIQVENGSLPVPGATISLSSNQGGSFSNLKDEENGSYTAQFTAELQNTNPTLTILANMTGFTLGQAQITVLVKGIPDLVNSKAFGIPFLWIALGIALLFFITLMAIVAKKVNESPRRRPFYPDYAVDSSSFPGRLI